MFIDRQLSAAMKSRVEPEDLLQEVSAEAIRSLGRLQTILEPELGEHNG